jgi:hypothetical protein
MLFLSQECFYAVKNIFTILRNLELLGELRRRNAQSTPPFHFSRHDVLFAEDLQYRHIFMLVRAGGSFLESKR